MAGSDPDRRPFRRLVTTREGGVSQPPFDSLNLGFGVPDRPEAVRENRSRLAARIGLADASLVWMRQVHGKVVATVDGPQPSAVPGADAIVTTRPGLALAVLVADCVPVLAGDADSRVIGAAHAGRRGAASGVLPVLIGAMVSAGAEVDRLDVLLGPAICGRCYQVPAEMQAEVEESLPGSACRTSDGTSGLDLRAGLTRQLRSIGVDQVTIDARCTREDPQLFSHRRSAPSGRFAGVIWLV